jgi:hypothetical protein
MIYAKILKKLGALSPYFQPPESGPFLDVILAKHETCCVSMDQAYFFCNPREKQLGGFPYRKLGQETRKGNLNVYSSHSGTFMQVQEAYVKAVTRLFNRRQTNVTPCLLLETTAL